MKSLSQQQKSELQSLEEELWRKETRFDNSRMRELMADDFFEFGMSGRCYTIEDSLAFESQEIKAQLPLPEFRVHLLDENVVQVTYNSAVDFDGEVVHARRSSIWTRHDGKWQLRFHQGTQFEPAS